jgi:neopullulanase
LSAAVMLAIGACSDGVSGSNVSDARTEFDTQYLPDGVQRAEHRAYIPDGKNFQEARIDPPFWWTEMTRDTLQLLIYDKDISGSRVKIRYAGIEILNIASLENPNYFFITILITSKTKPGTFPIVLFRNGEEFKTYMYELKPRVTIPGRVTPVTSDDIMYMIMPDRFANGDASNDSFDDMLQSGIDRSKMYFRHGGDLQGVIDHLDYLTDLDVSALWMTPIMENDQPYASYHGYAITDLYKIDRRFGTNDLYVSLASKCQLRGIKLVKDLVFNHVGNMHWFIQDIPSRDWIHQFKTFTRSNHSSPVINDPHASSYDKNLMLNGWFDYSMPDLNQRNPFLAEYLIQNAIWWIEYAGVDGFRLDTYQYPDQDFMREMGRRLLIEYPDFYYFGETNVPQRAFQSSFAKGSPLSPPNTVMPGVCDFHLNFALKDALANEPSWNRGVYQIYYTLADDTLYSDPSNNVIFLDNHDMDRIYAVLDYNPVKLKSALSLIMTMRGIPCIYYGTEFGFKYRSDPDGKVRQDVPGGWVEDERSVFVESGRTSEEQDIYTHLKTLASFRKSSDAIRNGVTTHYAPHGMNAIYTFFRTTKEEMVMVVFNSSPTGKNISMHPYEENLGTVRDAQDIMTEEWVDISDSLFVPAFTTLILEPRSEKDY